jgi:alpha-1,3-rhamnosyl/mannosyltransferase
MKRYCLDARTDTSHFPGIGRYVRSLVQAMKPLLGANETLYVLTPATGDIPEKDAGIEYIPVDISNFELRQQWGLRKILGELEVDVYHSPYYLMPYFLSMPMVLTIHDFIPQFFPQYVSGRARLFFKLAMQLAVGSAQKFISVSEATRQDFLRLYNVPSEQVATIHHGAYAPDFDSATPIEDIRQKYQLPENYVLYVGINKPHKNLAALINGWQKVVSQQDTHKLVIAGSWDTHYPEPKLLTESLGLSDQIKFIGRVDEVDLPSLYRAADVFAFPSKYEGLGFPVLEAMACGTAVLCSNISSLPEVVGDAAVLVDPDQPGDIAKELLYLIQNDDRRAFLVEEGYAQTRKFSWESCARAVLEIYRGLAYN